MAEKRASSSQFAKNKRVKGSLKSKSILKTIKEAISDPVKAKKSQPLKAKLESIQTDTKFTRTLTLKQLSDMEPLPDSVHGVAASTGNSVDDFNGRRLKGTPYRVGRRIGSGSFGQVRLVRHIKTHEKLAVKLELYDLKQSQLGNEWTIYNILNKTPAEGIAKAYHYGICGTHRALVLELLGPSLEQVFRMCGRSFSLEIILLIAIELINRIECVHSHHIIHRDIKPENFLICKPFTCDGTIFMVDFGLSKFYVDPDTQKHIPYRERCSVNGTPRYLSLNAHMGIEPSRRDDLEAIGYVLIYLLRGSLPWQGCGLSKGVERNKFILGLKKGASIEELCRGHPIEFVQFMQHVRKLSFYQKPNYNLLRELFVSRLEKEGYRRENGMDWHSKIHNPKLTRRLERLRMS